MLKPRYILRIESTGLRAEFWVNDIPVGFIEPSDASPMAIPVNEFLLAGRNGLGVVLHAAPIPSRDREPWSSDPAALGYSGPAKLRLTVAEYAAHQTALGDDVPPLQTIEWQGHAAPIPEYVEKDFRVTMSVGPWSWETATKIQSVLDSSVRSEVVNYITYLHKLLAERKFDAFIEESSTKIEEVTAGAYGVPSGPFRRDLLKGLQIHSTPPYVLEPVTSDTLDLRIVASGRMVECLRRNRRCALEFTRSDALDTFFLPTMIALKGRTWRLLR